MNTYEVRELHEWHRPDRWAVHYGLEIVARFESDSDAYKFINQRIEKPGLYCKKCSTRLMVKNVCTIFCPNKGCK